MQFLNQVEKQHQLDQKDKAILIRIQESELGNPQSSWTITQQIVFFESQRVTPMPTLVGFKQPGD